MGKDLQDERFAHIAKDPRFRRMRRADRKVKIDKRFKGMFSDKQFKLKYTIDKRGRPVDTSTNENLRRFYDLSDSDEDEDNVEGDDSDEGDCSDEVDDKDEGDEDNDSDESDDSDEDTTQHKESVKEKRLLARKGGKLKVKNSTSENVKITKKSDKKSKNIKQQKTKETSQGDNDDDSDNGDDDSEEEDLENGPDLARGEGNMESSSEEESDDSDDEISDDTEGSFEHKWGEMDKDVPEADELGKRLAVCNMDWDRIKAVDIFVLLSSFVPPGGTIHNVKIYPSEFGLQRMEEEKVKGPQELVETPGVKIMNNETDDFDNDDADDVAEDNEGSRYHREKLRQYQLNRLRYYYAVVECDSIATANQIYSECDGIEYESSATKIDLRFIPDDMTFDQEPKSVCEETPGGDTYKPSTFLTSALSQSKVNLTWDETDQDRLRVTMRASDRKGEVNEDDFKAYLASSSDEGDDAYGTFDSQNDQDDDETSDEESHIEKYKMLLQNIKETEKKREVKDVSMEVTWEPGLKETTEKLLKKKEESKAATPWEEYLIKKKEKRKKKKEERKEKETDGTGKAETKKGKTKQIEDVTEEEQEEAAFSDDDIPSDLDLTDPYFAEELQKGDKKVVEKGSKKKKKKKMVQLTEEEQKEKQRKEAELALLMEDEGEESRKHFSLKKLVEENQPKKKKKKKNKKEDKPKKEDDFQIDTADKRFEAMFSSHLYNIDPTAPEYKNTKAMAALVDEKIRRRTSQGASATSNVSSSKNSHKRKQKTGESVEQTSDHKVRRTDDKQQSQGDSLASLVQSVKSKTQKFHSKSKR